jgi:hypothetical protein
LRSKTPEQELDEFLLTAPSCLRDLLRVQSMSREEQAEWFSSFYWWRLLSASNAQRRFEELLKRLPSKWREYCKLVRRSALLGLPSAKVGRPRQDNLAQEAEELERAGLSQSKIALELNRRHPDRKDHKGNLRPFTSEAVRKMLARSRETRPDKT